LQTTIRIAPALIESMYGIELSLLIL